MWSSSFAVVRADQELIKNTLSSMLNIRNYLSPPRMFISISVMSPSLYVPLRKLLFLLSDLINSEHMSYLMSYVEPSPRCPLATFGVGSFWMMLSAFYDDDCIYCANNLSLDLPRYVIIRCAYTTHNTGRARLIIQHLHNKFMKVKSLFLSPEFYGQLIWVIIATIKATATI